MIEFKRCELYLYIITLETEMYLHDCCDIDSRDSVLHYDEKIISIFTDEISARIAFQKMEVGEFFNEVQIEYDINYANLRLRRYIVVDNNEAEDVELLLKRSLV